MIEELINLADNLDKLGMEHISDEVDSIIKEAGKKRRAKSEKRKPTKPALWSRALAEAKKRFKVYPCVPVETSYALTRKGWKGYSELSIGDEIVSYNRDSRCLEWDKVLNLNFFSKAPTVRLYKPSTFFNFICTEDHNWVIENTSLKKNNYNDKLVSAGSITKDMNIVTLAKMEDSDEPSLLSSDGQDLSYVEKVLSMSSKERNAWLESVHSFSEKNDDYNKAIEICAALLGYRVLNLDKQENDKNMSSHILVSSPILSARSVIKETADICDVWCPETNNKTWLMKQGGTITVTGNSAYANGWALQWYKKKGGGWRGKKPIK
jgi:hypothetical protein